jgi:hypothetical protein
VFPVIPVSDGHALSLGVLSYHGSLHFAAYADPVTLPEARELPTLLSMALVELLEACDTARLRAYRSAGHQTTAASSSASRRLGREPTSVSTGSPPLNTMKVGAAITS